MSMHFDAAGSHFTPGMNPLSAAHSSQAAGRSETKEAAAGLKMDRAAFRSLCSVPENTAGVDKGALREALANTKSFEEIALPLAAISSALERLRG